MSRAADIALMARRFRLLADRVEYALSDRGEVLERVLGAAVPVGELDRTLILHASELDRLCAHAVRSLSNQASRPVLDVLSVLSPDRLVAIYMALPADRRERVRKDAAWAYHVERAPDDLDQAIAEISWIAQITQEATRNLVTLAAQATPEDRRQTERHELEILREEIRLS